LSVFFLGGVEFLKDCISVLFLVVGHAEIVPHEEVQKRIAIVRRIGFLNECIEEIYLPSMAFNDFIDDFQHFWRCVDVCIIRN
jgi:hypothetical protein